MGSCTISFTITLLLAIPSVSPVTPVASVASPYIVKGTYGYSVTLPCDGSAYRGLPADDQLDVLWQTDDGVKVVQYFLGNHSEGSKFSNRVLFHAERIRHGNFSITIKSVKFSDEGKYECVWSGKHFKDVHLYVLAPHFSTSFSIPVGNSVTLPCYGQVNKHAPENLFVQWKRGDELVLKRSIQGLAYGPMYDARVSVSSDWSHGNFSLTLRVTGVCDEGVYQCSTDQNQNVTTILLKLKDYGHFTPVNLSLGEDLTLSLPEESVNVTFSREGTLPKVLLCSPDDTDEIKPDQPKYRKRIKLENNTLTMENVTSDDVGIYTVIHSKSGVVSQAYRVSIMHSNDIDQNYFFFLILIPVTVICVFIAWAKRNTRKKRLSKKKEEKPLSDSVSTLGQEDYGEKTPFKMATAEDRKGW